MGIFVRSGDQARVVAVIREFWRAVGAKELDEAEPPVPQTPSWEDQGVRMTGRLGYGVWPAGGDEDGTEWVMVRDSEDDRQCAEMAKVLAEALDVLVVSYGFEHPNAKPLRVFRGASPQAPWRGEGSTGIEAYFFEILSLPYSWTGYHSLLRSPSKEDELPEGVSVLGFAEIPYRERGYHGPGEEEHRELARQARQRAVCAATDAAISANDVAALRALYAAEPEFPKSILSEVSYAAYRSEDCALEDPKLAGQQRMVLAMAEELLMASNSWWAEAVAEAAFCAGDHELFRRAMQSVGGRIYRLKGLVRRLMNAKEFDRAIEVLSALTAHDDVALTLWRPLAQSVLAARELPADAAEILTRCEARGMADPEIFHETARAWLRLGDPERALRAVGGAVNAGYWRLDEMRTDEQLTALVGDPRFAAAFESGSTATASDVLIVKMHKGKPSVAQRPVLRFDFFPEGMPAELGPALAELVEAYLADVPAGGLTMARSDATGSWGKLTQEVIAEQLGRLRAVKPVTLHFRGELDERGVAPTEYGLHVETRSFYRNSVTVAVKASVWFPAELAQGDVDVVAARFARYAALMPTAAGGAGLHVMVHHYHEDDEDRLWRECDCLWSGRARFLGTEDHPSREGEMGTAAGAMWLSYLGAPLVAELGGRVALAAQVAPALVEEQAGGAVIVRASLRPGLGVAPRPRDLGALPKVARVIERLTPKLADVRPADHYRRLLKVPVMAYENGPPVVADARMREAEKAARAARARGGGVR